jgi:hypothetical protein
LDYFLKRKQPHFSNPVYRDSIELKKHMAMYTYFTAKTHTPVWTITSPAITNGILEILAPAIISAKPRMIPISGRRDSSLFIFVFLQK